MLPFEIPKHIDIQKQITIESHYVELLKKELGLLSAIVKEKDLPGISYAKQLEVVELKKRAAKVCVEIDSKETFIKGMKEQKEQK